ncbi:MAG TPA: limonene-1,2-epoxide hydrolase family protein, partial [Dehalococcoidia bacterium]|nr:limonene-1,2-epoxide hydrolase family protein [Dehalococcoidia bacterium]
DGSVLTERLDKFALGGKKIELPVMGVFELTDGKIAAWRDYFDMAAWTRQTTG